ncbi:hypothetical protein PK98_01940 [Croceibacterium mercuriale]|uniref:TonB-dependent receptor n=1 Tax=Croceibacterium mercuriale TaxID=1572751 RepID=A0A0B2BV25_9SPHN|nr:TonB-dependent receptor [Croceibacterium mercuriale]KHL25478.1 hypothetical protein PK98_01940 [Croceibacterium mercuriale]
MLGVGLTALTAFPGTATAQDSGDEGSAAIVVTGSRVRTDGMQMPVPVTVVSAAEIETLSPGSLVTGLSQLPQFYGNQTPASGSSRGSLNLRGLGLNRTLTLLNGRRVPATTASGGADISLFPESLIRAVETTTGGASAAYGTDAVAGVVNFILDTDFTGLELQAQSGITSRRDGQNQELSAAFGTPFADGRGHLLLGGEYARQSGIDNYRKRDWYQGWGTFGSGTAADPYRFAPGTKSRNASFDGNIRAPGTVIDGLAFDRDGNVAPFVNGTEVQGVFGTPAARHAGGGSGEDLGAQINTLIPDADRYSLFGYAEFEATDNLTLFAQYMHGNSDSRQQGATRSSFTGSPATLTIFRDNAFLPDGLRQTMAGSGISSFTLRRVGSVEDIGILSSSENTVQHIATGGFALGLDTGGMLDGWQVDGFYQYGHSRRTARQFGLRLDRVYAAIDAVTDPATGDVVCRVSLFSDAFPGCQPLNLFGRGNASAAAIDYVTGFEPGQQVATPIYFSDTGYNLGEELSYTSSKDKVNVTAFEQQLAELSAAGDLFDGWAGPVAVALGGSWRQETIRQVIQDVTNPASDHDTFFPVACSGAVPGLRGVTPTDCANTVGVQYSKLSNINGSARVWEAFGELLFPLLDTQAVDASLNLAGRWASYSGSGTIWAWKAGLDVGLIDWVRLRGTWSRDVRAANLAERFDKSGGSAVIDDPRTPAIETLNVIRYSGGNPAVDPERADTYTAGIVLQPPVVPGLSLSVDWYDIRIKDAIGQVGTQAVIDRCFRENAPEFCALVTTDPASGDILLVGDVFINVAQARVSGVDAELSYATDLSLLGGGDERLSLRAFASWLTKRSETNSSGVTTDYAGQIGATQNSQAYLPYADFKAIGSVTYRNGDTSGMVQGRYVGPGTQDATLTDGVTILDNSVDDVLYVDARLAQRVSAGAQDAEPWLTVTNLFDQDPPITPSWNASGGFATQTNAAVHDLLGRRYTVGATLRF